MDKSKLIEQLKALKEKQALVDSAWQKTGNRAFLEFLVQLLPGALNAERAAIFVHDPQHADAWIQCGTGLKEMQVRVPTQGSVVGEVVTTGKPVIRRNLEHSAGAHSYVDHRTGFTTRDIVAVPIIAATTEGVAGVIEVLNKRTGTFTDDDVKLLEKAAFHVRMNIDNLFMKQEWATVSEKMSRKIAELEKQVMDLKRSQGNG